MQILIQGSGRRVKLTKGEHVKVRQVVRLLRELSSITGGSAAEARESLAEFESHLDSKGEYKPPVEDAE